MTRKRMGGRIGGVIIAMLVPLLLVAPTQANAAVNVSVVPHVCYGMANVAPGSWGAGVNYTFGSHGSTSVRIYARYSWGLARGANGVVTPVPSVVTNQYHVRMIDWSGRVVWQEYNAIPNGGSRSFGVGSNVKQIQVIANSYAWGWTVGPGVGLDS